MIVESKAEEKDTMLMINCKSYEQR
jgi:hypothetical protein